MPPKLTNLTFALHNERPCRFDRSLRVGNIVICPLGEDVGPSFYGRSLNDALNRDRKVSRAEVDESCFLDRSRFGERVFKRNYI